MAGRPQKRIHARMDAVISYINSMGKIMKHRVVVLLAALFLAGSAMAQQPQQARPAAAQPPGGARNAGLDPNAALNAAFQVAQMVDAGRTAELWDGASAVTKRLMQKQAFVEGVTKMRKPLGPVQGRAWMAVRRQQLTGTDKLPAGNYISVELAAQVAGNKRLRELVTFRVDEDGVSRFSGYVME